MNYPDYDKTKCKAIAWPHFGIVHWVVNPAIAFNELVLGMRVPNLMLVDQTSDELLYLRTYVPCPHCGTLHPSVIWSKRNGFGHWYGYLCTACDQWIPCLRNWTSRLILLLTYPLWIFPSRALEPRWRATERARIARGDVATAAEATAPKVYQRTLIGGLLFGLLMWLFLWVVPSLYYYATGTTTGLNLQSMLSELGISLIGGLLWGLFMGLFMQFYYRRSKRAQRPAR